MEVLGLHMGKVISNDARKATNRNETQTPVNLDVHCQDFEHTTRSKLEAG